MTQPEQAPVAMAAAEAAWYERDGIDPREAWQAGAHAGFPEGFKAGAEWAVPAAAELKANLQAAIERVERTAAAAQAKAVADERDRIRQLAEQVGARYPDVHTAGGLLQPVAFVEFARLLRGVK